MRVLCLIRPRLFAIPSGGTALSRTSVSRPQATKWHMRSIMTGNAGLGTLLDG